MKKLRVPLTRGERRIAYRAGAAVVAVVFTLERGRLSIREEWSDYDEIWSDGVTITLSGRIIRILQDWLARETTDAA